MIKILKMSGISGWAPKVSKSRKQILKFSFEPKNEQKYFCISALASKTPKKCLKQKIKAQKD